jgi:hypothetical protein
VEVVELKGGRRHGMDMDIGMDLVFDLDFDLTLSLDPWIGHLDLVWN